jgi:7-carboxy-7-deazaguanine synthase
MRVAEFFYSIQGEGITAGVPAVFIRLSGCNLSCGISPENLVRAYKKGWSQDLIEKMRLPEANWVCDTISVWLKGKQYTNEELFEELRARGFIDKLNNSAHLILTGGEPTLFQKEICSFIEYLYENNVKPYTEIETNGTIVPDKIDRFVSQYNVSIKLSNSGMPYERRIKPDAIIFYKNKENAWFKFVVVDEKDAEEVMGLQKEYSIPSRRIILMPGASNRDELIKNSCRVVELAKKYGFRYCSRLQLEIWNKRTGV